MSGKPRKNKGTRTASGKHRQQTIKPNPTLKTDYSKPGVLTVKYWLSIPTDTPEGKKLRKEIDTTLAIGTEYYDLMIDFMRQQQTTTAKTIHKQTYETLSEKAKASGFPTAYIQAIRDDAIRDMKSWNTNHPDRQWELDSHRSKSASMSLDRRTLSFNPDRMECTVSKIGSRFRAVLDPRDAAWFFERHSDLKFDMRPKSGRLGKQKRHGRWCYYVALCYKFSPVLVPFDVSSSDVVGVDRGIVEPFVTSYGDVASGVKHDHAVARRYDYNVGALRAKGSRAARRKLRSLSGRRARFSLDCARRYAHELVDPLSPGDVLVLEDLSTINLRTIGKFEHSGAYNRVHSHWNHGELLDAVVSLALQCSVFVVTVNPAFSSQECPRCGFVSRLNRFLGRFECEDCHFAGYADSCAAFVVRGRGAGALLDCLPAEYWKQGDVKLPNGLLSITVHKSSRSAA